jgi:ferric-chelate reductase
MMASYSAAMFAVGGSGITFALAAIQDLIEKDLNRASRVKVIDLIWVVPDASEGFLLGMIEPHTSNILA